MSQSADFFVSYTSTDRALAEWIAWQLEAEGYTVIVQAWDFTAGRDWAHEMQHATATAERVVAVLSAAYLRSAHGEAEWRAFYVQDPSGERGLLLPVRVDEVDPPGLLRTRIYVDLVGQDAVGARQALLAAVRRVRGKPTQEPEFPGDRRPVGSATEAPRFPGELPPVWNLPYHPNPYFTGRDLLLAEIHARLTAQEADRRRVVLTGLGGMGKTRLAVEHAYRQRADYDLPWWVRSEQPPSLLGDYAALAEQPPLAADFRPTEGTSQEAMAAAVRGWLERHRRWLLVFDNVEEPANVAELLPRSGTGHVLVTTQAETGWEPLADPVPVEVLAPTDAAGFVLSRTKQQSPEGVAAATTLASSLGGLPLALEQAASYIEAAGTVSLADYAQLFATRALELLKRGQPLGYQHTVATTWSLALQRLRDAEPAAVDLLTLASFLAPDDLPLPLLTRHADELPEPMLGTAADPLALADAVAALRRYSLVRVVADGLYVHRLLQIVVRTALDAKAERVWAATAVRLIRAGFPEDSYEIANWPECQRLLPHALAAAEHGKHLDAESESWPWLLSQVAIYLWSRGRFRQALPLERQALAARRRLLGREHPHTLRSRLSLAEILRSLGRLNLARMLLERTLIAQRRVLGEDHPETLWSMHFLAVTLRNLDNPRQARTLYKRTLIARRRVLGEDHPDTLWSMHGLAETLSSLRGLDNLREARTLFQDTLVARQRILGEDHPDTLWSMHRLAETLHSLGELEEARMWHEETLDRRRRVLGDDHPHTLTSMSKLADTRRALGDLQGARDLLEQSLAPRQRVLGEDHPDTLASMNKLAVVRRELGGL